MHRFYILFFLILGCGCSLVENGPSPAQPTPLPVKLTPEWVQLTSDSLPPARCRFTMSYDRDKNLIVLFGGRTEDSLWNDDTWQYEGTDWTRLFPEVSPPPRYGMKMVYDNNRQLFVLTGGYNEGGLDVNPLELETFEFDYQTWRPRETNHKPPNRASAAMVYHPLEKCCYLFGGTFASDSISIVYYNDLWRYDGQDWTEIETVHKPCARRRCEMVFDSTRGRLVLFGGDNHPSYFADTWEFDGNDWTQVETAQSPSPRGFYGLTYDNSVKLTILFGGQYYLNYFNDTWTYDGSNWRRLDFEVCPERRDGCMVYNEARHESYLFSGTNYNSSHYINDQWVFRYTAP